MFFNLLWKRNRHCSRILSKLNVRIVFATKMFYHFGSFKRKCSTTIMVWSFPFFNIRVFDLQFDKRKNTNLSCVDKKFVIFSLFAMQLGYYNIHSVWSKVGTRTVYIFISCILMPLNCIGSGKGYKMYAIFTMLVLRYLQHFQIK